MCAHYPPHGQDPRIKLLSKHTAVLHAQVATVNTSPVKSVSWSLRLSHEKHTMETYNTLTLDDVTTMAFKEFHLIRTHTDIHTISCCEHVIENKL